MEYVIPALLFAGLLSGLSVLIWMDRRKKWAQEAALKSLVTTMDRIEQSLTTAPPGDDFRVGSAFKEAKAALTRARTSFEFDHYARCVVHYKSAESALHWAQALVKEPSADCERGRHTGALLLAMQLLRIGKTDLARDETNKILSDDTIHIAARKAALELEILGLLLDGQHEEAAEKYFLLGILEPMEDAGIIARFKLERDS